MVSFLWVYGWTILHGSLAALAGPAMVSSTWRKPAMTMSSAAQVALVDAALQKSTSVLATNGEFAATLYSEMAEFDVVSNQTKYQVELKDYLSGSTKSQQKSQEPESMAHASIRAYAAYKDPVFLQLANESWAFAQTYTLFGSAAASGSLGFKNFTMNSACQAKSMVGGTFDTTNATDTSITAFASASFFAVSALLAEATSDPVYLKAAFDSADFIWGHLSAQNLVQTAISADACALDDEPNSFNTGLMIEGLAVLYSVTQNATTQAMLNAVINATITNGDWQTEDGIIVHGGSKLGDKYLVRGLAAAYARDVTARELRAPVHDYIAVQFNAVVDLASSNGNAIYGGAWTGPPSTVFSQSNQTTAISALLSGMALHDADTTSLLPPGPFPSSPPLLVADPHRGRMAMMVGGTIGGVVLLTLAGHDGVCLLIHLSLDQGFTSFTNPTLAGDRR
ncbi:hypothetical protein C8R46DRAFT_1196660 [Mycena filopes]|nr:hypothetical protein C8R46DRAFT_1196660 [Mycena filopes]